MQNRTNSEVSNSCCRVLNNYTYTYTCRCMQNHNGDTIIKTSDTVLRKIYLSL